MQLDVSAVCVDFGGLRAVDEATVRARPGEITGLIGPNGAGKTTLFNVICGYIKPQSGSVRFGDADVTSLGPVAKSRKGLARTFQRLELFDLLTVRENIQVAAEASKSRADVDDILSRVGLGDMARFRADELPTGQARLLEVGRALATNPHVLLLDEPAAGLNESETNAFASLTKSIASTGTTVVLVEHDMPLVMEICDRIYVLNLGKVIAEGSPSQIQADKAVIGAYLGGTP
jgi:branched-chain amino acid transport system ATP-binding protein